MKNILITTLLACATINCSATNQRELLVNLKNIRSEIENKLSEITRENQIYLWSSIWNELLDLELTGAQSIVVNNYMHTLQTQKIENLSHLCSMNNNHTKYTKKQYKKPSAKNQNKSIKFIFLKLYRKPMAEELTQQYMRQRNWEIALILKNLLAKIDTKIKELEIQA